MPGTGHSHRYKGSISNRNTKPAFQVLAPWNSRKNGEKNQIPVSTGGDNVNFKLMGAKMMSNYNKTDDVFTLDCSLNVTGNLVVDGSGGGGGGFSRWSPVTGTAGNQIYFDGSGIPATAAVGIGTTTPTAVLDVSGDIKLSDGLGAYIDMSGGKIDISGDNVTITGLSGSRSTLITPGMFSLGQAPELPPTLTQIGGYSLTVIKYESESTLGMGNVQTMGITIPIPSTYVKLPGIQLKLLYSTVDASNILLYMTYGSSAIGELTPTLTGAGNIENTMSGSDPSNVLVEHIKTFDTVETGDRYLHLRLTRGSVVQGQLNQGLLYIYGLEIVWLNNKNLT